MSMDYMYLHERSGTNGDTVVNPPHLVVVEHRHGRIWAYRVPNKGVMGEAEWLPKNVIQDLHNSGMQNLTWHVKANQEPSIVALQAALQAECPDQIIPTNSPVGESACNGRAENAIRRLQEKVRALRHQIESGIRDKVPNDSPIMAWMVRWAAEILSKYNTGDDNRSPYQRIRKEDCAVPLAPFGESVMYLPLRTLKHTKGKAAKQPGVWLGVNERTEETLIGTRHGVVKCRTVSRLAGGDQWSRSAVLEMRGLPWEPVPGKPGQHIPVNINEHGQCDDHDYDDLQPQPTIDEEAETERIYKKGADEFHVSQRAIAKFGETPRCPACRAIQKRGAGMGRIGFNHSQNCKERITELMKLDPEYSQLVDTRTQEDVERSIKTLTTQDREVQMKHVRDAINHINKRMPTQCNDLGTQLDHTMLGMLAKQIQVAEVYNPPRVVEVAKSMGLRGGWSLDLTTHDEHGHPWDFNKQHMRNKAVRKLLSDKPLVLIGSPMCTAYSTMNRINYARMDPIEVEHRLAAARKHLEFCARLYDIQWRSGRYFLHGHPDEAGSWQEKCIQRLLAKHGVIRTKCDQCMYGLKSKDEKGIGPARKRTRFMTNSPCVARRLSKMCPNGRGYEVHRHVRLENGRTKAAQIYPRELCRQICEGIREQMEADQNGQFLLAQVTTGNTTDGHELKKEIAAIKTKYKTIEEDDEPEMQMAWDDVSGAALDPKAVIKARQEEVEYVRKMGLYTKVPKSECIKETGRSPISVRWIDINNGDVDQPNYRSRLVAREINTHKREDLFAATPPLEALKVVLSLVSSGNKGEILMIHDISRAFFHAPAKRRVYVQLAAEDQGPGEENLCGRLNFSMYGTRDAAQNWYDAYSQHLKDIGFQQGLASPCTFYHKEKGIRTYVHGDDYVSVGRPKHLEWMQKELEKCFTVKTQRLGPQADHLKEVKILNRVVAWHEKKIISYEADPRHVEILLSQLRLEDARAVATPGTKEEGRTQEDQEEPLGEKEATSYRTLVARCNYLAPDKPDIAYTVKELARSMASPRRGDWTRLKRLGRYLSGRRRVKQWFLWQPSQHKLVTYSDADWAGCRDSRKSTTGGVIATGRHTIKGWSKAQSLIALSSGESELYATLKAAAETLGLVAMYNDFGLTMAGEIWGDARAALGIINRNGLGKTRHIDTGLLWIQQTAAQQRLKFDKLLGKDNPADLYTKYLDWQSTERHTTRLECEFASGRANETPQLHRVSRSMIEYEFIGEERQWPLLNTIMLAVENGGEWKSMARERRSLNSVVDEWLSKNTTHTTTDVWRQVLWGYKWQAQLDHPWGSTLTFQHKAGVSYGIGLRHGVTMHPRGTHLREGMILPPHGVTHQTAREQQPTIQHNNYHQCTKHSEKWFEVWHNNNNYNQWWRPWKDRNNRDDGIGPGKEHQEMVSEWCYRKLASPARRQPEELYCKAEHRAW